LANLFAATIAIDLLLTVLILAFASSAEWKRIAVYQSIAVWPLLAIGITAQMIPLRCRRCGIPMKWCSEHKQQPLETVTTYHFCMQCKHMLRDESIV
jgi:hypothetical protein